MSQKPFIHIRGLSKTYKLGHETVYALSGVDLDVNKGEMVAIVGPSGSGKTTLVHTIGGIISPDSGEIYINGEKIDLSNDKSASLFRNKNIGFVFQNYSLLINYTVLENVMLPMIISGTSPNERKRIAMGFLKAVGLEDYAHKKAHQLSGGQRQRVGVARALSNQPKLIIADEPTGNLDSKNSHNIMTIFQKLSKDHGITILLVTHDHNVAKMADRVIFLKDGQIGSDIHAN